MGFLDIYFTTKVDPIEVTAWPILLAPVARKAAILSVVPDTTWVLLLKPKLISSLFCIRFKTLPGTFIKGNAFSLIGNFEIQSGQFLFRQSYPNFNELFSSE